MTSRFSKERFLKLKSKNLNLASVPHNVGRNSDPDLYHMTVPSDTKFFVKDIEGTGRKVCFSKKLFYKSLCLFFFFAMREDGFYNSEICHTKNIK